MVSITDAFLVYSFMKRLVLPFNKWPAYKAGIIDAKGNVIKKRNTLNNTELAAWGRFDIMIANLKKLIARLPGGSTMIASTAAAAFLFRECRDIPEDNVALLEERFSNHFGVQLLSEDVAANVASSGAVAALDDNPPGRAALKTARRIMKRKSPVEKGV
jgi:hypothetical protein